MLSKRKSKNSAKNLSSTLQVEIDPLVNKLEYTNNKRPSRPSLPNLSPLSSCYQRISRSLVFISFTNPAIPPDCITLYTLNRCGLGLGTNLLSWYNSGRQEREETTMISHQRMSSFLSLKGGCVVLQKRIYGFLFEQTLITFVGNEGIYSMGEG